MPIKPICVCVKHIPPPRRTAKTLGINPRALGISTRQLDRKSPEEMAKLASEFDGGRS
jgi:hypothetical protein